jgi:hypothetical protein
MTVTKKRTAAQSGQVADIFAKRQELLEKAERLDPELEEYLVDEGPRGLCLRHPLVQQFDVSAERAALWNKIYKDKMRAVEQAIENRDWHGYVFLHERPSRLDAFCEIEDKLYDETYWALLSDIWLDSESSWQQQKEWSELWNTQRSGKHLAMNADEHAVFVTLTDELTIYRGIGDSNNLAGMSWTLDRAKAIWFARRFGGEYRSMLLTARAKKSDVHAILLGRGESEIVIDTFEIVAQEPVESEPDAKVKGTA